jgi:uncharacterized repeat protein (TIGR01451 family)
MKPKNVKRRDFLISQSILFRISIFVSLALFVAIPSFFISSASSSQKSSQPAVLNTEPALARSASSTKGKAVLASLTSPLALPSGIDAVLPLAFLLQAASPAIATFEDTCATATVDFNLNQTVCAKATSTGGVAARRRITWVDPSGFIRKTTDISSDSQDDTFGIPSTPTTTLANGQEVTNTGTWRVNIISNRSALITFATFFVKDEALAQADLAVEKQAASEQVAADSVSSYNIFVHNSGPSAATAVVLTDVLPANTTFESISPETGTGFNCVTPGSGNSGTVTCTIDNLNRGESMSFVLFYKVLSGTPNHSVISNTATVTSATAELNSSDNSSTATVGVDNTVVEPCTIQCPANRIVTANTTSGGQFGAFVTYGSASVTGGNCGTITNNPVSGSFFPAGISTVTSSASAGPTCTFTVKVLDTPAPTISCPPDKVGVADAEGGTAMVDPGTPTFTASGGGTVVGVRNDGTPAVLDEDGTVITPANNPPLAGPYPIGATGITWTVTDADGRTASCTQTIRVHAPCTSDEQTPTITAPGDITVSTGPGNTGCSVALDDELGQADANDDCTVTVTITGLPPGNEFPIGTTHLTYTATDGAGHTATDTQDVTVVDDTPPVIAAPADATYTCLEQVPAANPSQATRGQVFDEDGIPLPPGPPFDNCGMPTVTVTETSTGAGTAASPRIITRVFTATDGSVAHNSSSSTQTITVIDSVPPTITAPANVTANTGPGAVSCGTTVTLGSPVTGDNCAGVIVTRSPAGNTFPVGGTDVVWTATDAVGNTSTATQHVTVIDNTPPTISCQANIVADFNPAVNGAVVTYTAPVGADNCASTTAQVTGLPSGATFPLGTTTNTFRVTDASGNTAECSFKVTVALTSLIGLDSVTITGAAYADSYSSAGGYPATRGSLVNVLSNGTIILGNSGKVWGNVRSTRAGINMTGASRVTGNATAGTTVSTSGSASVGGTKTNNALAPVMTLPSVPVCGPPYSSNSGISGNYSYNASTGDLNLSGVNIATLANGNYCFHNVTIGNSSQLKVNGPVVIRLTGTLSTSGATSLNNTTQIPSNLRILSSYSGSNGLALGNSSSIYAVFYSPNTGLNISGAVPLFGTAAAKTITLGNSGAIHYDTQLKTIWPDLWTLIVGP